MKVLKVRDVKTPTRGTSLSAGIDFFVPNDFTEKTLMPQEDMLIPSGIKAKFDDNLMLMAAEKSGVTTSRRAVIDAEREPKAEAFESITILGAKIVDADYQGEIHIHIINVGRYPVKIKPGFKIAQFILVPVMYDKVEEVSSEDELYNGIVTERGEGGIGLGTGNE
jgi:dUTPase|nr:MAG TPA: dUTPase [Caudoviricetes sp.]